MAAAGFVSSDRSLVPSSDIEHTVDTIVKENLWDKIPEIFLEIVSVMTDYQYFRRHSVEYNPACGIIPTLRTVDLQTTLTFPYKSPS